MAELARGAALLVGALLVAGCSGAVAGTAVPIRLSDSDRGLVRNYFDDLNSAGEQGLEKQHALLEETQHPDYRDSGCRPPDGTIAYRPAMGTLRLDNEWAPAGGDEAHPRGVVLVVAVTITVHRDGVEVGSQIGSQHVVLLNGRAYGFAPCAA